MIITSVLTSRIFLMTCSILEIVRDFLDEYPLDLWISTSFTLFSFKRLTIFSSSNSLSIKSICSYLTPCAFKDCVESPHKPIISCNESYGVPVKEIMVSPCFNKEEKVKYKAFVPLIICGRTRESSVPNTVAKIFSSLFLPSS